MNAGFQSSRAADSQKNRHVCRFGSRERYAKLPRRAPASRSRLRSEHDLVDDEAALVGDLVVEPASPSVVGLGQPVHAAAALAVRPLRDLVDQSAAYALAAGVGVGEQILQVTDVGGVRVRVAQEVGDADQLAIHDRRPAVNLAIREQPRPRALVLGVLDGALVEGYVATEQTLPVGAVRGLQAPNLDLEAVTQRNHGRPALP